MSTSKIKVNTITIIINFFHDFYIFINKKHEMKKFQI